jgi:cysteine synthase A
VHGLLRLFNEPEGQASLCATGCIRKSSWISLPLLGISAICNLVSAIKTAKYFEYGPRDMIFLSLTDGMSLYASRVAEQRAAHGPYDRAAAARHFAMHLEAIGTDHLRELTYPDRQALHNFKYFTWVEQQQRDVDELRRLWDPDFWTETFAQADEWDRWITEFNTRTGVLDTL